MATKWKSGSNEEWGPWVLHDGKGCPLKPGVIADVVSKDRFGFEMRTVAVVEGGSYSSWNWDFYPELKKIVRYREKKPRGLQLLEESLKVKTAPKPASKAPQKTFAP